MNNLNLNITFLKYNQKVNDLKLCSNGIVECHKDFPIYYIGGNKKLFKPLSKEKPFLTPFFAYSEVIFSYVIHNYFDSKAPIYNLAVCEGIDEEQLLSYNIGTIVNYYLKDNQKQINLLEYYQLNPDNTIDFDINNYINLCPAIYNYLPILKSKLFIENESLGEQLAFRLLLSYLIRDVNFHYENVGLILENDKVVSLIPPIDYEYSAIFIYAESIERRKIINDWYNNQLNNECLETIKYCLDKYPETVERFLNDLNNLAIDLENYELPNFNKNFIGTFNSDVTELQRYMPYFINNPQPKLPAIDEIEKIIIEDLKNNILTLKNIINKLLMENKTTLTKKI